MKRAAPFVALTAAVLWVLTCVRWFDAGAFVRPAWLDALPPLAVALPALLLFVCWLYGRRGDLCGDWTPPTLRELLVVAGLSLLVRVPLALGGAAGYTTPDAALSGIVALHIRDGVEHLVFVPQVPYSGSLKSHLAAALSAAIDPARAFTLCSAVFYAFFVGGVYRLALLAAASPAPRAETARWVAFAAGLYLVLPPVFVTHYSLSNDGNYVEVLAFGTWALVLASEWVVKGSRGKGLGTALGLLLGLAFWCHILAVIHAAAIGLALLTLVPREAFVAFPRVALGFLLGYCPGLLWNAGNGWESLWYLLPGGSRVGSFEAGPGLLGRLFATVTDLGPVLLGYDPGYASVVDTAMRAIAWMGVVAVGAATVRAAHRAFTLRRAPSPEERAASRVLLLLLLFTAANLVIAVVALPYLPGNPRYLLFLMAPIPVFLALALGRGATRFLLGTLIAFGGISSAVHASGPLKSDREWRGFVSALERESVRWCFTDFYLATKINFLSQEHVICSAKLGPTTTEYFFEYRRQVDEAPEAALIAANVTAADKLERRLERLGVGYERRDLMKPVLLRLDRKVDPQELFPGRDFPLR